MKKLKTVAIVAALIMLSTTLVKAEAKSPEAHKANLASIGAGAVTETVESLTNSKPESNQSLEEVKEITTITSGKWIDAETGMAVDGPPQIPMWFGENAISTLTTPDFPDVIVADFTFVDLSDQIITTLDDLYTNPENGIDDYPLQANHDYRAIMTMYSEGDLVGNIKFDVDLPETISAGNRSDFFLDASDANSGQSLMMARLYLSANEDIRISYIDNTAKYTLAHNFDNDETLNLFDKNQGTLIGDAYKGANNVITITFDFRVSAVK